MSRSCLQTYSQVHRRGVGEVHGSARREDQIAKGLSRLGNLRLVERHVATVGYRNDSQLLYNEHLVIFCIDISTAMEQQLQDCFNVFVIGGTKLIWLHIMYCC